MKIDIISLFPEFFESPLSCGILRIAREKNIVEIRITNPRDFTEDGVVDDYQFGGGAGMVMKVEPLAKAIASVKSRHSVLINLTPKGVRLNQEIVGNLAENSHIIIICGRYKGIDERINDMFHPLQLSIGDYILSGGEIGSLVLVEAVTRLLPDVLGNQDSADTDSFESGLLEAPIYTRPEVYKKFRVPPVLRSGNHNLIAAWRKRAALRQTLNQRPELFEKKIFSKKDLEILLEVLNGRNS
ncbi:MAG TPA: tRNA (guanosine(37)-N1)-methyltransferase TrmD [candidate division WOR-3 bacterium]|uniref:tRNA (guanine-N(1)-)-methyltransferase n=1 Tax=candidate division WOR-3 bacterium TaxID=2052148 RepID=A0A9C9JZL6_UNCW3|nr:tRNA (guanosine(37)-N1)-methyltransferase TrmD [candidate division WOR-3 bacterium]